MPYGFSLSLANYTAMKLEENQTSKQCKEVTENVARLMAARNQKENAEEK